MSLTSDLLQCILRKQGNSGVAILESLLLTVTR